MTRWADGLGQKTPQVGFGMAAAGQVRDLPAATAALATASGFGLGVWLGCGGAVQRIC